MKVLLLVISTLIISGCTSSGVVNRPTNDELIVELKSCVSELKQNMTDANNAIDDAYGNFEDGAFSDAMSQLEDADYYTDQRDCGI